MMYFVDSEDTVTQLLEVPQSSVGAPCPVVLCGEHHLHLAYCLQDRSDGLDGTIVRVVGGRKNGESIAHVEFAQAIAHMFGSPNDEAFNGHPLASRGVGPYRVYEVHRSSWIRRLERMNAEHPDHRPEHFVGYRHFIFSFHDTTFECIARSFTVTVHTGSMADVLERALRAMST